MSTYVFSDVHGRYRALIRMMEAISPTSDDKLYMLGGMADRGPNGVKVIQACKSLENSVCLMGNHEEILLDCFEHPEDDTRWFMWAQNGSSHTLEGLEKIEASEKDEILNWVAHLPFYSYVKIADRYFILTHAGIIPPSKEYVARLLDKYGAWCDEAIEELMDSQDEYDLRWVREGYWNKPTNLVDDKGNGPIVVSGHTITPYVEPLAYGYNQKAVNEDNQCQVMFCGACEDTGQVPDKIAIDCGCAAGYPIGRLACLRLDDMQVFYEEVREDE